VPLIIMAPIPLTIIGVMPGHALLGAQFTATSMIGMIALAGIIVRNSILLVDFINQQVRRGHGLREAVIQRRRGARQADRADRLAAMIGAVFILDDPIFNGLAISLIFGIFVSTLLTLVVIPVPLVGGGLAKARGDRAEDRSLAGAQGHPVHRQTGHHAGRGRQQAGAVGWHG
jgi:multidrug efflux pump subunit AcrB